MSLDLRQARRAVRLTQAEVARDGHISRPRLSFAEAGFIRLRSEELERIRKVIAEVPRRYAEQVQKVLSG